MDNFIKYLHDYIVKSWKTTFAGVALFILTFLVQDGKITQSEFEMGIGVLTALGFTFSKDADQTHSDNG